MMKIRTRWVLILVVALALAGGLWRALAAKRQAAAQLTQTAEAHIDVREADVWRAREVALLQTLPITGTIKAVNFAAIKAKVAGEIKEILVREGDAVAMGQPLVRVDPVEFESRWQQAREQAESAKSQLEIAQRQFDTNQALVAQGFIAKVALENSLASLRGAQASYQAAQAGAAVARKALDDSLLRAPFAGVVASRLAQVGERVALDAKILELVDPGKLEVEVALSAADSVDVRVGQQATLRVEGRAQAIQARVKRVSPSAQAATRSVLAFLELPAQEGLRHGLFVEGSLELRRFQTLAVPLTAVRTDRPQPYVQWVQENQDPWRVAYAPVQLGPRGRLAGSESDEAWVAVQGVSAGQQILRGEVGGLREGLRVRAVTPAAAGAAGSASAASAAR